MVGVPEGLIITSEIILASYPILIKSIPTNLWTQIASRMLVYGGLAFTILLTDMKQLSSIAPTSLAGGGLLNLLHIATSYKAFADLPAGNAMAIFYAYPAWNLLGAWILLGEKVPMESLPWVGLAIIGMILVAQPDLSKFSSLTFDKPLATASAVLSGMTESAIYFFFKMMKKEEGTFKGMFELYGGSFMWMLPVILGSSFGAPSFASVLPKIDFSWKVWLPMILFNAFIGFSGYAMRFKAIPMVSTLIFSALNFVGIVAAYLFGYLFQGEKPSFSAALGAFAIIVANGVLLSKN